MKFLMNQDKNVEKHSYSMSKSSESEIFTLTKKNDKEDITKTVEKISNGWLLSVEIYNTEKGTWKCIKKYFENNPLMETKEQEEKEKDSKTGMSEFDENWDILELK
jgi:hypothetical protein